MHRCVQTGDDIEGGFGGDIKAKPLVVHKAFEALLDQGWGVGRKLAAFGA